MSERVSHHMSADEASDDDVLRLNVGGEKKLQVMRRTLTFCGGVLGAKFSGRWDLPRDLDGYIFLDHDPDAFGALIAILREKVVETPRAPVVRLPSPMSEALWRLLEYYDLTMAVCSVVCCRGRPPSFKDFATFLIPQTSAAIKEGTELHLQASSDCCYFWSPGNTVLVHSFEIELTQVVEGKAFEIGWFSPESRNAVLDCSSGRLFRHHYNPDGRRFHNEWIQVKNELPASFPTGPLPVGTRIRSEDRGTKWFLNGNLWCVAKNLAGGLYKPCPCFVGEGTCKIVSFEYEFATSDL